MFASCASATILAASACSFFAMAGPYRQPGDHRAGGDILALVHKNLCDSAVDPSRNVKLCRVHLALDQQRRWLYQIPDRQGGNGYGHTARSAWCRESVV
jgi:hypothetical protein